jgi:hypothetical protein
MMRGGFLDPNWMLATNQVHRWVGRIRNLGSLEFQAVVALDLGGGGGMRLALLRPSGMVLVSTNPYVTLSTTWSSATTSTSISVSSVSAVVTTSCGTSFVAIGSLTNARRPSSSAFWSAMMTFLSTVSFKRALISHVRV